MLATPPVYGATASVSAPLRLCYLTHEAALALLRSQPRHMRRFFWTLAASLCQRLQRGYAAMKSLLRSRDERRRDSTPRPLPSSMPSSLVGPVPAFWRRAPSLASGAVSCIGRSTAACKPHGHGGSPAEGCGSEPLLVAGRIDHRGLWFVWHD